LLAYSGSSSVLKQVWLVGSLLLSGPSRWITHLSAPRPPMGALRAAAAAAAHAQCVSLSSGLRACAWQITCKEWLHRPSTCSTPPCWSHVSSPVAACEELEELFLLLQRQLTLDNL
jgi:hypothetical protein